MLQISSSFLGSTLNSEDVTELPVNPWHWQYATVWRGTNTERQLFPTDRQIHYDEQDGSDESSECNQLLMATVFYVLNWNFQRQEPLTGYVFANVALSCLCQRVMTFRRVIISEMFCMLNMVDVFFNASVKCSRIFFRAFRNRATPKSFNTLALWLLHAPPGLLFQNYYILLGECMCFV